MKIEISSELAIKIALLISTFISWVIFEETIIDRHGLHKYLPLYRFGNLCLYDITVFIILVAVLNKLKIT